MREFKFRVWNPQNGRMHIVKKENHHGSVGIIDNTKAHDRGIWMQYTGRKDIRGTEICEGDILICDPKNTRKKEVKVVEYVVDEVEGTGFKPLIDQYYDVGCLYEEYLIAGNIYEDPGMLEDVQ